MRRTQGTVRLGRLAALGLAVPGGPLAGSPALDAAEKAGEKPGAKEIKGRVESMDVQAGRIVLTVRGRDMTFEVPQELRGEPTKVRSAQRLEIDDEEKEGKPVAATIEED